MATDPLREQIAIIKQGLPEIMFVQNLFTGSQFNFIIRSMALAYKLAESNTLARIQKEGKA